MLDVVKIAQNTEAKALGGNNLRWVDNFWYPSPITAVSVYYILHAKSDVTMFHTAWMRQIYIQFNHYISTLISKTEYGC
jgi:hypothetical protein